MCLCASCLFCHPDWDFVTSFTCPFVGRTCSHEDGRFRPCEDCPRDRGHRDRARCDHFLDRDRLVHPGHLFRWQVKQCEELLRVREHARAGQPGKCPPTQS